MAQISCRSCTIVRVAYVNAVQAILATRVTSHVDNNKVSPYQVWKRFGGHCLYCGQEIPWKLRSKGQLARDLRDLNVEQSPQLDHWIPSSLGGPSAAWNMLLSCRSCNIKKKDSFVDYPLRSNASFQWVTTDFLTTMSDAQRIVNSAWGNQVNRVAFLNDCDIVAGITSHWCTSNFTFLPRFPRLCKQIAEHVCKQRADSPKQYADQYWANQFAHEDNGLSIALEREAERELFGKQG